MSDINPSDQIDALACKTALSIKCTPLKPNQVLQTDVVTQTNINRLNLVLNLDEVHYHELDEDAPGLAQEFQRVDFKINIILEMVGQLVLQGSALPEPVSLVFNPYFMEWQESASSLKPGQRVQLELFPDMRFPFPLVFYGTFESTSPADGNLNISRVSLDLLDVSFQELLEKYIFRCHRRQVARMRQNESSDPAEQ